MKGDIGVIGLAVMGQNLILNMNDHGFKVVAHNRTAAKVDEFLEGPAKALTLLALTLCKSWSINWRRHAK